MGDPNARFQLIQRGNTLTGLAKDQARGQPPAIQNGKIDGNTLSFDLPTVPPRPGRLVSFVGKVTAEGIFFTRAGNGTIGLFAGTGSEDFIVTRQASSESK